MRSLSSRSSAVTRSRARFMTRFPRPLAISAMAAFSPSSRRKSMARCDSACFKRPVAISSAVVRPGVAAARIGFDKPALERGGKALRAALRLEEDGVASDDIAALAGFDVLKNAQIIGYARAGADYSARSRAPPACQLARRRTEGCRTARSGRAKERRPRSSGGGICPIRQGAQEATRARHSSCRLPISPSKIP